MATNLQETKEPFICPLKDQKTNMRSNTSFDSSAALHHEEEEEVEEITSGRKWFQKLVDMEEAKKQVWISFPMILTNVFYYCIPLISVMFAGHLGHLQLAGATLANSWASLTGFNFMTGASGSLETLCGQGFGARQYNLLGIYLQSSCIISLVFSVIISVFWFYTEPILVLLHQDPRIAEQAAIYIKYLIPGLFAYGLLQNILRFFQTQSIVKPLIVFSAVSMGIHFAVVYVLVCQSNLGYIGASLSASVSLWISTILLGIYLICSERFELTWNGFSLESFRYILTNLKLSLPSAAMVFLEFWTFEVLVFMAGVMPYAEITTSLIAICVNTANIAYMLAYGLSAAVSTRVSNELGAGNRNRAKKALFVTIKLSCLVVSGVILILVAGHNVWAGFFSDSPTIHKLFSSMTPFLAASIALDAVQGVLSGVARACGWQHLAVCSSVVMFGFVGTPMAALLGFKFRLYAKGLWIGLICGLFCQGTSLLLLTLCISWRSLNIAAANDLG